MSNDSNLEEKSWIVELFLGIVEIIAAIFSGLGS